MMVYVERDLKITSLQPPAMGRSQEHLPPDQADLGPIQLGVKHSHPSKPPSFALVLNLLETGKIFFFFSYYDHVQTQISKSLC